MLEHIKPTLNMNSDAFADDAVYHETEIDTPFFFTTTRPRDEMTPDQRPAQALIDEVMDNPANKSLIVRSRYGSGNTAFLAPPRQCAQSRAGRVRNLPT